MILSKLYMSLCDYGPNRGKFLGTAEFTSKHGKVEVRLNPEKCEAILALCADSIVEQATEVANALVLPVIEQKAIVEQIS